MQERDRFTDALLHDDMRRLNSHLPKNRRTLRELLDDPSPFVPTVSGDVIRMKRRELELMSSSLPDPAKERIRLPVILLRRSDLGPGAFIVLGDPYEEYAMSSLAGAFTGTFDDFKRSIRGPVLLYKPQVSLLLRRFHSLLTIGFGTTEHRE